VTRRGGRIPTASSPTKANPTEQTTRQPRFIRCGRQPTTKNEIFTFKRNPSLAPDKHLVNFEVWDKDMVFDDFLGHFNFYLPPPGGLIDAWFDLEEKDGKPAGQEHRLHHLGKLHLIIFNGMSHPEPEPDPLGSSLYFWKGEALQTLKKSLKTGDCLLFSGSELVSFAIKWRFGTPYSHCGLILRMPDTTHGMKEEVFVAEADWGDKDYFDPKKETFGIILSKFEDRIHEYSGNAIWYCPLKSPLSSPENVLVCEFALKMRDDAVKFGIVHGIEMSVGLGKMLKDEKTPLSVFCSEFVARALQAVGRIPLSLLARNSDPYDVVKCDCYDNGMFPKVCLRYQVAVDPAKISASGLSEIMELFQRPPKGSQ